MRTLNIGLGIIGVVCGAAAFAASLWQQNKSAALAYAAAAVWALNFLILALAKQETKQ